MPRPRNLKSSSIPIRLSVQSRKLLEKAADLMGVSVADFIRMIALARAAELLLHNQVDFSGTETGNSDECE